MLGRHDILSLTLVAALLGAAGVARGDFDNPKAKTPPAAKPNRQSAGESVPPLPLPATPLRRSEKKREPAPPALVGMITFSGQKFVEQDGQRVAVDAFPTTQIDIEQLTKYANQKLGIQYRYVQATLDTFSWDPVELPLLYITGWTPMPKLDDKVIEKLRRYLYDGGTIVFHSQCGRDEFGDSARREIARIFPDRQLARIDLDSPLFHSYFRIADMKYRKGDEPMKSVEPNLEGVYVGCRPAIIFSAIDLNCSWDVAANPIAGGTLYNRDDGLALGVNIITCALANLKYARAFATEKIYHEQEDKTRDQLVIGQIVHAGDWDPTPHALPNLMKYIAANTTLNVQFKRAAVNLGNEEAFNHPVLYMTGLRDFKFSDTEVTRLRAFLTSGGILIADSASGAKAFDAAFRRELKRVLPKGEWGAMDKDSAVYQAPFKIRTVDYTEPAKKAEPDLNTPSLQAVTVDGTVAVIYSSYALGNGWEQIPFAYSLGYADDDALRLGVNILTYAITH